MNNDELLAVIQTHRSNSYGAEDSELTNERAAALDHYYGRPYGDEEEGHSQVVSRDLKETVEWIKPALIKIFVQSGNIAEFVPVGPEDEEGAEQETDTVNHIIMSENNGVLLMHDLFHDALLLKNAYCKHYYQEEEIVTEEEYHGLTEDELLLTLNNLSQESEIDIKEQDERIEYLPAQDGQQIPITLYDVCVKITRTERKYIVEPIPSEEIRVSKRCKGSLQDSPFTEHVTTKTRTELIEMGMDEGFVYSLPSINDDDNDTQSNARDTVEDEYDGQSYSDLSMDEIEYCEAYIRVDFDGDKKAELRKVISVGNKIPPGKEWNEVVDSVNITSITAKRVPHRHIGESIDDELSDLQRINTSLKRQLFDNVYRINSTEKVINERVDIDDALRTDAGNVIRVDGDGPVQDAMMYAKPQSIIGDLLPAIDMINRDKEQRTGINETNTNIDPDVLKDVNNKVYLEGVAKASQKVEMIARLLAEGVKEICLQTHKLLIAHQDKPLTYRLRGKYVSVNPQEWKHRTDMKIRVGLGTGTEEEKRMKLAAISAEQARLKESGLVTPENEYALFVDMANTLGEETPEKYVIDPNSDQFQQHKLYLQGLALESQQGQTNPLAEAEQIKGQFAIQKTQLEVQMKGELEQFKQMAKAEQDRLNADHKASLQALQVQLKDRERELDRESKEAIEILKAEVELLKAGIQQDIGQPGIGGELE